MTRFAHLKKSKESESFVVFLPRLITEPGLVLNFSATALRNSVVRIVCLSPSSSVTPQLLSFYVTRVFPPQEYCFRTKVNWNSLSDTHMPFSAFSREVSTGQNNE